MSSNLSRIRTLQLMMCVVSLMLGGHAVRAGEGGAGVWLPGLVSSLAAVPPEPGFSLPITLYGYSGSAGASKPFLFGRTIAPHVDATPVLQFYSPTYVPDTPVLGGRLAITLTAITGYNGVTGAVTGPLGRSLSRTDTVVNVGALLPQLAL
jgi:hypothetical protein